MCRSPPPRDHSLFVDEVLLEVREAHRDDVLLVHHILLQSETYGRNERL